MLEKSQQENRVKMATSILQERGYDVASTSDYRSEGALVTGLYDNKGLLLAEVSAAFSTGMFFRWEALAAMKAAK